MVTNKKTNRIILDRKLNYHSVMLMISFAVLSLLSAFVYYLPGSISDSNINLNAFNVNKLTTYATQNFNTISLFSPLTDKNKTNMFTDSIYILVIVLIIVLIIILLSEKRRHSRMKSSTKNKRNRRGLREMNKMGVNVKKLKTLDKTILLEQRKAKMKNNETLLDIIQDVVKETGFLTLKDIIKGLNIKRKQAEQLVKILADSNVIKIRYTFGSEIIQKI